MADNLLSVGIDISAIDKYLSDEALEKVAEQGVSDAAAILLNRIRTRFLATMNPDGVQWPVSQAALDRAASGRDGKTLFDTGTLFHSIQLYSISPLEMAIGTDVPYGIYHQEGTKHLPIRQFLGFGSDDHDLANNVMLRAIEDALQ